VVLNAINLPDSVANLYFKAPKPDLQTLLYTTDGPRFVLVPVQKHNKIMDIDIQ
jgi:hypothetical protein